MDFLSANFVQPAQQPISLANSSTERILKVSTEFSPSSPPLLALYRGSATLEAPVSVNAGQRTYQMKAAAKTLQNSVTESLQYVVILDDDIAENIRIFQFLGYDSVGRLLITIPYSSIDLVRHSKKDKCLTYLTTCLPDRDLSLLATPATTENEPSPTHCHVFNGLLPASTAQIYELFQRKASFHRTKHQISMLAANRKFELEDKFNAISDSNNNNNNCDTAELFKKPSAPAVPSLLDFDDFCDGSSTCNSWDFDPFKNTPGAEAQTQNLSNLTLIQDLFKLDISAISAVTPSHDKNPFSMPASAPRTQMAPPLQPMNMSVSRTCRSLTSDFDDFLSQTIQNEFRR